MSELFQEELIAAAQHKQNFGQLPQPDRQAYNVNPSCGDTIVVQINLSPDEKTIQDIKWSGDGCIISQAAMSKLSEAMIGQAVADAKKFTTSDVLELLKLTNITPGRTRCLALGLATLQSALDSDTNQ